MGPANLQSLNLQSVGRTAPPEPPILGENQGAGGGGPPNEQTGQLGLAPVPHLLRGVRSPNALAPLDPACVVCYISLFPPEGVTHIFALCLVLEHDQSFVLQKAFPILDS